MPTEAPNTLRSRARYKIIDVISQGPIIGLVNGAKSVFLNETPIQSDNDTLNFKNFDITKDLQELPIPDIDGQLVKRNPALFPLSENDVSVGVKVTKNNPVTRTITDLNLDSVKVTLRIPALTKTNTTTGDITGNNINFSIEVKPSGGAFALIPAGTAWESFNPNSTTPANATGLSLAADLDSGSVGQKATWQYRRRISGEWGPWVTYSTNQAPSNTKFRAARSIDGLPPGEYQARIVVSMGSVGSITAKCLLPRPSSISIGGKTVSPYDVDYLVQLPGNGPWDIRVTRLSDDPATSNIQSDLYWLSYTEQVNSRFSWPNVAGVAITFDAEDFGGAIPTRAYDVMGLIIKIPSNYDPYSRTYSGIWNGTFKEDWTDNPAWIFYDLLTNKRYGLGDNIDAAQIDKFALYQIAQYCDELVDAPNGEQEPRYTCSCVINTQSEAYELLTAIASAFRGMIYHSGGTITPTADMPSDPVLNVGPANVIDGTFTYQGASRKARHTVARVSWNNPDDGYKLNVEIYEDADAIRKYGYRPIDINAFGCTSRGLARRWGKWAISSDNDAPDTVTYKAGFDHFKLRPGDVINISDPNYSGEQLFGLIADVTDNVSPATRTIKLDRAVTRVAGDTSELQLTLADGTILLLDVAVTGSDVTSAEITVDSAELITIPLAGASWLLKKGTVEPRQWRVISISEDEPHIYQVTAMLYDPNKYDKVESDLNFAEADFTAFPSGSMPAPTGVAISEFLKQTGSAILSCATVSWTRPNDPRADWFEVQYQLDGEEWRQTEPNLTQFTSVDILNTVPGVYNFRVRAQDSSGIFRSEWATLASQTLNGKNKKPEDVTGFTATIEKYGVLLSWLPVSDIDINFYEIRKGASWTAGTLVAKVKGTAYKWEDATEATHTFWIKAVDTSGNYSTTEASATVTLVLEAVPTITAGGVKGGITIEIAGVTTSRFAHYEVQRKQAGAADGTAVTLNALLASRTWTDNTILAYPARYVYRARAFNRNLNPSSYGAWSNAAFSVQIEDADLSADAIKMPTGSLLSLTAKNCTTASIAEVDGVKDVSGNGNHGRAYGGVEVVDSEMGKAFQFDGFDDIIHTNFGAPELNSTDSFTISVWAKYGGGGHYAQMVVFSASPSDARIYIGKYYEKWTFGIGDYTWTSASHSPDVVTGEWIHLVLVVQKSSNTATLYANGKPTLTRTGWIWTDTSADLTLSRAATDRFNGLIANLKIYSRALSPSEIKTLYMFPGDVAFGQLTADLIGANVIKAQNLIQSEAVITNKAQINSGVFNEILVLDSDFMDTADTAVNAQSDANTALDNANTALNGANAANSAISNMTNDDKLTPDEKQSTKKEWDIIVSEKSKNDTQADSFGVSKTAYGTAYSALSTYITPLLSDLTTTSDIVGTTFRAKFKDYYDARTDLLNAIATESKRVADTAKTAVDNWAVAGTNYTEIKGGVITTGQIKSGDYVGPAVGESFAQSGSSYDLDNASITTENFYSNNTGAGIKGHIEADSGRIGRWNITTSGGMYCNVPGMSYDFTSTFQILSNAEEATSPNVNAYKRMMLGYPGGILGNFGYYADFMQTDKATGGIITNKECSLFPGELNIFSNSGGRLTYDGDNCILSMVEHAPSGASAQLCATNDNNGAYLTLHSDATNSQTRPSINFSSSNSAQSLALRYSDVDKSLTIVGNQGNEVFAAPRFRANAPTGPASVLLSGGINSYGESAIFGLTQSGASPMIGYGVKPHPSVHGAFVSSYGANLGRIALLLDGHGFRVFAGGAVNVPVDQPIPMTERFKIDYQGVMTVNGHAVARVIETGLYYIVWLIGDEKYLENWGYVNVSSANYTVPISIVSIGKTMKDTVYSVQLTPGRSAASFTWMTVSNKTTTSFQITSNSLNGSNYATTYEWRIFGRVN